MRLLGPENFNACMLHCLVGGFFDVANLVVDCYNYFAAVVCFVVVDDVMILWNDDSMNYVICCKIEDLNKQTKKKILINF